MSKSGFPSSSFAFLRGPRGDLYGFARAAALRDALERSELLFRRHLQPFRDLLQSPPTAAAQPGFGIHLAYVAARGRDGRRRQTHAVSPSLAARRAALAAS